MAEIILDVRGLEPPEPYERATELLTRLQSGQYLRMISPRRPRLLYPWLRQRGLCEDTRQRDADLFEIFVWTEGDSEAGAAVKSQA